MPIADEVIETGIEIAHIVIGAIIEAFVEAVLHMLGKACRDFEIPVEIDFPEPTRRKLLTSRLDPLRGLPGRAEPAASDVITLE